MTVLALSWFNTLAWVCPNDQTEWAEPYCDLCGRHLTANDLTPQTSQEPSSSREEASLGSQPEGR